MKARALAPRPAAGFRVVVLVHRAPFRDVVQERYVPSVAASCEASTFKSVASRKSDVIDDSLRLSPHRSLPIRNTAQSCWCLFVILILLD